MMDGQRFPRPRHLLVALLAVAVWNAQGSEGLGRSRRPPPPHLRRGGAPFPIAGQVPQQGGQVPQQGDMHQQQFHPGQHQQQPIQNHGPMMQQQPMQNHGQMMPQQQQQPIQNHGPMMPGQQQHQQQQPIQNHGPMMPGQQQHQQGPMPPQQPNGGPQQQQFAHRRIQFGPPPPKFRGKHPLHFRRPPPPHHRPPFHRGPPPPHHHMNMKPPMPTESRIPPVMSTPPQPIGQTPPQMTPPSYSSPIDPLNPAGLPPPGHAHQMQQQNHHQHQFTPIEPTMPQVFTTNGHLMPSASSSNNGPVVLKYGPPYGPFGHAPKQNFYQSPAPATIIHANIEKNSQENTDQPKIIQVHLPQPRPGQEMPAQNVIQIHITSTPKPPTGPKDYVTGSTFKPPVDIITKEDIMGQKPIYGPPPEYPGIEYRPSESRPQPVHHNEQKQDGPRQDDFQRRPDDHFDSPNSFEVLDKHSGEEHGKTQYHSEEFQRRPPPPPVGTHYNKNDNFRPEHDNEFNKWNKEEDERRPHNEYRPDFRPADQEYLNNRDRDQHEREEERERDYHREREPEHVHHHHSGEPVERHHSEEQRHHEEHERNREPVHHDQYRPINRDNDHAREPARHQDDIVPPPPNYVPPRHMEVQDGFDYKSSGSINTPDYGPPTPDLPPKKIWIEKPKDIKKDDSHKYSQPDPLYHVPSDGETVKNSAELHYQAPPPRFDNSFSNDYPKKAIDVEKKYSYEPELKVRPPPLASGDKRPSADEVLTALGLDEPLRPQNDEKIVNYGHYKPYNLMDYIRSQLREKENVGKDKEALFSRHGLPPAFPPPSTSHSSEIPAYRPPQHFDDKPIHSEEHHGAYKPVHQEETSASQHVPTHYAGPPKVIKLPGPGPHGPHHQEAPDRIGVHGSHEYSTTADAYFPKSDRREGFAQQAASSYGPAHPHGHLTVVDEAHRRGSPHYGPPSVTPVYDHYPHPVYVTEPEPIIEIIVQDSNVTLPPPPPIVTTPAPPPTPEPVHVFYVQYSSNKTHPHLIPAGAFLNRGGVPGMSFAPLGEPEISLERPIASVPIRQPDGLASGSNPIGQSVPFHHQLPQHLQQQQHFVHQEQHQPTQQYSQVVHPPQQQQQQQLAQQQPTEVPQQETTTLRTIIRLDSKQAQSNGLGVTFDHPPTEEVLLQHHLQQLHSHQQQQQQNVPQQQTVQQGQQHAGQHGQQQSQQANQNQIHQQYYQQQHQIQPQQPAQQYPVQQQAFAQPQQVVSPQLQQYPQQQSGGQPQVFYQPPTVLPQQPQQQVFPHPSPADFNAAILGQSSVQYPQQIQYQQPQQQAPIQQQQQAPIQQQQPAPVQQQQQPQAPSAPSLPTPLIAYPYGSPQQLQQQNAQQQQVEQQPQPTAPQQQQVYPDSNTAGSQPEHQYFAQQPTQYPHFQQQAQQQYTQPAQNVPQYLPNPLAQANGVPQNYPQNQYSNQGQFQQKTLQAPDATASDAWSQYSQPQQTNIVDRSDAHAQFQQRADQQAFQQPFNPSPQYNAPQDNMMPPSREFASPYSNMPMTKHHLFDPNPQPYDPPTTAPSFGQPMGLSDMPKKRPSYENIGMLPPMAPAYAGASGMNAFSQRMGMEEPNTQVDGTNSPQQNESPPPTGSVERSGMASDAAQYDRSAYQVQGQQTYPGSAQQLSNNQFNNGNQASNAPQLSKEPARLPDDVPEDIRQQLMNSGILGNADVQVINFDENLFKQLGELPPEALAALNQQSGSLGLSASNIQMAERSQGSSENMPSTSNVWNGGQASLLGENASQLATILGKRSVRNVVIVRNNKPRPKRGRGANRRNLLLFITDKEDVLLYNIKKNTLTRVGDTHKPLLARAVELSHHKFNLQVAD